MSSASVSGTNLPSNGRNPEAPGDMESRVDERRATARGCNDERPVTSRLDPGARNPDQADDQPQPIDPALIAGGEGLVGIANDMTSGADATGASTDD